MEKVTVKASRRFHEKTLYIYHHVSWWFRAGDLEPSCRRSLRCFSPCRCLRRRYDSRWADSLLSWHGRQIVLCIFLEVGTRLYIAPEVQSRKRGLRHHTKADMYSLGVCLVDYFHISGTNISISDCFFRNELHILDWFRTHRRYWKSEAARHHFPSWMGLPLHPSTAE